MPSWDEFAIRTDSRPEPDIADPEHTAIFLRYVSRLRVNKAPHLVALHTFARQTAQMFMLVRSAGLADIDEQFQDSGLGYVRDAFRRAHAIPVHQTSKYLRPFYRLICSCLVLLLERLCAVKLWMINKLMCDD